MLFDSIELAKASVAVVGSVRGVSLDSASRPVYTAARRSADDVTASPNPDRTDSDCCRWLQSGVATSARRLAGPGVAGSGGDCGDSLFASHILHAFFGDAPGVFGSHRSNCERHVPLVAARSILAGSALVGRTQNGVCRPAHDAQHLG